jgi:hypothetical protein
LRLNKGRVEDSDSNTLSQTISKFQKLVVDDQSGSHMQ